MWPLVARSSKGDLASRTIAEISTPWVSGMLFFDEVRRLLRTAAKEKFFHLFFKEFAGVGVDRRRALFIDQHGLVGNPPLPSLSRDAVEDALADIARIRGPVESLGLDAEQCALDFSCHSWGGGEEAREFA